ncbi:hypothetical protein CBR_g31123 [Chara braunii]|uniref:Integrase catalytic domain-containing protein n=1 Tax=Chara braunii TaxID=69332 RepID=A0A388LEL7_CHABU|nr:hypothetical protein CBR_g31123 [Chara braunii]|eukprot:GBG80663.1 hypothetical protein CBR_g31123 [Chara braunii]
MRSTAVLSIQVTNGGLYVGREPHEFLSVYVNTRRMCGLVSGRRRNLGCRRGIRRLRGVCRDGSHENGGRVRGIGLQGDELNVCTEGIVLKKIHDVHRVEGDVLLMNDVSEPTGSGEGNVQVGPGRTRVLGSQHGIGAVLVQQEGKKLRPVEYMSRKMPSQKLAKSTYEKELYVIYNALTHWTHCLLGHFFYVRSDHQTLRWMKTQPVLFDALKRWIKVIEQYDFEPQYIKGEYNKVVDALSRRPDFLSALVTEFGLMDDVTHSLVEAYREERFTSEIIRRLVAKDKATSEEFELIDGLLFLEKAGNKRLCVPNRESLRSLFIGECHDATEHFGYRKTAANLSQRFWWPTMMRDVKLYVETCQVCQRDKPRTQAPLGLLKPLPILERPGESMSMDFMDTLVTSYVIVDRFSKYARLVAMPETAKTEYVIRLFKENWVRDFGLPESIISDRDV